MSNQKSNKKSAQNSKSIHAKSNKPVLKPRSVIGIVLITLSSIDIILTTISIIDGIASDTNPNQNITC